MSTMAQNGREYLRVVQLRDVRGAFQLGWWDGLCADVRCAYREQRELQIDESGFSVVFKPVFREFDPEHVSSVADVVQVTVVLLSGILGGGKCYTQVSGCGWLKRPESYLSSFLLGLALTHANYNTDFFLSGYEEGGRRTRHKVTNAEILEHSQNIREVLEHAGKDHWRTVFPIRIPNGDRNTYSAEIAISASYSLERSVFTIEVPSLDECPESIDYYGFLSAAALKTALNEAFSQSVIVIQIAPGVAVELVVE